MRGLFGAIGAVLLSAATAAALEVQHPSVRAAATPGWVEEVDLRAELEAEVPQPPSATAGLSYLLVDRQTRLAGVRTERYSRTVVRVVTAAGLEDAAQHQLDFDPEYARAALHHLRVWRGGRWEDRLEDAFVSVIQREADLSRRLYDGGLTVLLLASDLQVGDVVDFASTVEGVNPVHGGRYLEDLALGWSLPLAHRHVRVVGPAGAALSWRAFGLDLPGPEVTTAGGITTWRWRLRDLPAVDPESSTPPSWDDHPWLQLSQFTSWREVVDWALPLYDHHRPTATVRELADRLRADDPLPEGQALAAIRWVQDEVRYFAFTLGEGSHAPRPAEQTLRRRFGDCKDKTNLLVELLRVLGFEAWPAMVDSTGDDPAQRLPSPGAFDHVIVLARIAGREVWVDPTLQLAGGDLWHLALPDYRRALVVRDGESDLVEPPGEARRPGSFDGHTLYEIDADGACTVTVTSRHLGAAADEERVALSDTTHDELQDAYRSYYERAGGRLEPLGEIEITDDRLGNVLTTVERYRVEDWWEEDDQGRRFPLLRPTVADHLETCSDRDRRAPLAIPHRVEHRDAVTLELPAGLTVSAAPGEVATPHLTFVARVDNGPPVRLEWHLRTGADDVPPDQLAAHNEAVESIDDLLDAVVLESGNPAPDASTVGVVALAIVAVVALALVLGVGVVLHRGRWL